MQEGMFSSTTAERMALLVVAMLVPADISVLELEDNHMDEDERGRGAKRGCNDDSESTFAGKQRNYQGVETQENSNLARLSATAQGEPVDHCPGPVGAVNINGLPQEGEVAVEELANIMVGFGTDNLAVQEMKLTADSAERLGRRELHVIVVYMPHKATNPESWAQTQMVVAQWIRRAQSQGKRLLVLGDFNECINQGLVQTEVGQLLYNDDVL
ncbi:hypothetical protein GGH96_003247 [Coemansia sp. RSA 1972]|nr:hypothetical protein GGH96_003247 [Coemansia sp. RSA 1972]